MEALNIGFTIMVIGMSIVFLFLAIMIFAMNVSVKVIGFVNKYFPEEKPQESIKNKHKIDNDAAIALAIFCAAHKGVQKI